jgi:HK97 family phage major capsid protein/HK97 family phage prohead protease
MKLKKLFREMNADSVVIDEEARTVEFSFSSEYPVDRWFGKEVLSHERGAADLGRLNGGANLLWNHDPDRVLGVVETAEIRADRKGYVKTRFSKTAFSEEKFREVADKILRNVSFGYRVNEMTQVNPGVKDQEPEYLATKWMPFEVSIVSIPADPTVGIGRADGNEEIDVRITTLGEREKMPPIEKAEDPKPAVDTAALRSEAMQAERARIAAITILGDKFGQAELARQLVSGGQSIEEARAAVLERLGIERKPLTGNEGVVGLTDKEVRSFSFLRALHALANPHDRAAQEAASFERECSVAAEKKAGKSSRGLMVPFDVLAGSKRDLVAGTSTAGGHLVGTNLLAGSFIEILRNKSVMARAGATMLNGLVGNIAIPRQTTAATVYHVAENAAPTEGAIAFDQVTMNPKTIAGYIDYSRKLLIQGTPDIDNLVKADLASGLALGIDSKALYGSGSASQPTGLQNVSGLNLVEFGANAPTWAEIVDLESQVAADNADVGSMKYITNALGRGVLKTTERAASTGIFLMKDDGSVNGYPCEISNQVSRVSTAHEHYWFGVWAQLMIGFWSGLDLLVDPYTGSKEGTIRVVAMQDYDIGVRHAEAFALGYNS